MTRFQTSYSQASYYFKFTAHILKEILNCKNVEIYEHSHREEESIFFTFVAGFAYNNNYFCYFVSVIYCRQLHVKMRSLK